MVMRLETHKPCSCGCEKCSKDCFIHAYSYSKMNSIQISLELKVHRCQNACIYIQIVHVIYLYTFIHHDVHTCTCKCTCICTCRCRLRQNKQKTKKNVFHYRKCAHSLPSLGLHLWSPQYCNRLPTWQALAAQVLIYMGQMRPASSSVGGNVDARLYSHTDFHLHQNIEYKSSFNGNYYKKWYI